VMIGWSVNSHKELLPFCFCLKQLSLSHFRCQTTVFCLPRTRTHIPQSIVRSAQAKMTLDRYCLLSTAIRSIVSRSPQAATFSLHHHGTIKYRNHCRPRRTAQNRPHDQLLVALESSDLWISAAYVGASTSQPTHVISMGHRLRVVELLSGPSYISCTSSLTNSSRI
jgi:hypothetical protein